MGAYDYFERLPGPTIDTDLYSTAASRGVAAGNQKKTLGETIISGIKTGLDLYGEIQNIQIRDAQIDQIPAQNELRQKQIKAQETQNQLNELKLNIATETEAQALDAEKQKLLNEASKAASEKQLRDERDEFQNVWASSDPLTQKNILTSGKYNAALSAYPQVLKDAVQTVMPYMTPDERLAYGTMSRKVSTAEALEREAQKRAPLFQQAQEALTDDFYATQAANAANILPEDVPYKVRRVPSGFYEDSPEGLIKNPDFEPAAAGGREDYIIGNKIVAQGVPKESVALLEKYKAERAWQDGTNRNRALSSIDKEVARSQSSAAAKQQTTSNYAPENPVAPSSGELYGPVKPNPAAVSAVNQTAVRTPSGEINLSNNKGAYNTVQKALGLPTEYFEKVKPDVKEILSVAEQGLQTNTSSIAEPAPLASAIERVSTFSAGAAYDTNKDVQARYTQKMVEEHNKYVQQFTKALSGPNGGLKLLSLDALYSPGGIKGQDISQMIQVSTPKELYIVRNSGVYRDILNRIVASYEDHVRATKIAILKSGTIQKSLLQQLNQPRR